MILYTVVIVLIMSIQGCGIPFHANSVKPQDIQKFELFMKANQDFECQNDFVGAAFEYNVKKHTVFGAYSIVS